MSIKRFLSGIILFPIFAVILIFGNKYLVDVFISIIAIMSLHEFYKAFKGKANPIQWIGYITAGLISFNLFIPYAILLYCTIYVNIIQKQNYNTSYCLMV